MGSLSTMATGRDRSATTVRCGGSLVDRHGRTAESFIAAGSTPARTWDTPQTTVDGPLDADDTADLWPVEACQDPVDEDDGSGPCVVCGRRTIETVRPMAAITEPIWCCHEHDDRTIVRAWIHTLPEWQH